MQNTLIFVCLFARSTHEEHAIKRFFNSTHKQKTKQTNKQKPTLNGKRT